jgi:Tfp pilus assembly protein PilV
VRRYQRQRGITLFETTIALILLTAAVVSIAQLLAVVARQKQAMQRQMLATQEIANLMERLAANAWDDITNEHASQYTLSDLANHQLPGAALEITVDEGDEAKRIQISLAWSDRAGNLVEPVRLSAWKYAASEMNE